MSGIARVAVLGAGVMGSQVAAHLANCRVPSLLLDVVPSGLSDEEKQNEDHRNRIAANSKRGLPGMKPSPIYRGADLDLITVGNVEDDMAEIGDCDWIIEVVTEDLDTKRVVFEQVARYRKPGSIVTTNTSGIPLSDMVDVMDEDMRKHFLGTHFFNPPRYLKLMELIPGPDTLPKVLDTMAGFAQEVLGKGVVWAKDTPNFVGNRIVTFASQFILHEMGKVGFTVDEVDLLTGPAIGHSSSATFRTLDLVGLDTYLRIIENTYENCPDDERRELMAPPDWLREMVARGLLGLKTHAGFFKKTDDRDKRGKRIILSLDLDTFEYREPGKIQFECVNASRKAPTIEEKVKTMYSGRDKGALFLWNLFANTAVYACNRIPEITDDIVNIDNALKWGFGRKIGVFETWDALGVREVCDRMEKDGFAVPVLAQALLDAGKETFYTTQDGRQQFFSPATKSYCSAPGNPASIDLAEAKQTGALVKKNDFLSLIDLGDGILCAEFHSRMNAIDQALLDMIMEAVNLLNEDRFEGMVLGNQGKDFSVGANLMMILSESRAKKWDRLELAIASFQQANMAMRFCKRPIVAAPHHFTYGGAIEMCQHASRAIIAGETYGGLVETGVGLIPAGGGCKEMLRRAFAVTSDEDPEADSLPSLHSAFETIALAKVSASGPELIDLGYFTADDVICVNWTQQVRRARDLCRTLIKEGYRAPEPGALTALGEPGRESLLFAAKDMDRDDKPPTEHDMLIARKLAQVLTGGDRAPGTTMSEQDVLDLEREAFLSLCATRKSQQRMRHMLATGKPLRN